MKKKILITCSHSIIARNILESGLIPYLVSDYEVKIIASVRKESYFQEISKRLSVGLISIDFSLSNYDHFFRSLSLLAIRTKTLVIKRRADYELDHKAFRYYFSSFLGVVLPFIPFCKQIVRFYDSILVPKDLDYIFKDEKPDLIFSTDVQNEIDVRLIHRAQSLGIKAVGMVRSWDNLTCKGMIRAVPDILVVNNDILKEEAVSIHGIDPHSIRVVGVPHYDSYLEDRKRNDFDKVSFLQENSFDEERKTVTYIPTGDRYIPENGLDEFVIRTLGSEPINLIVRLPPADHVSIKEPIADTKAIIFWNQPGRSDWKGGLKTNEVSVEDDLMLKKVLRASDLVVSGPSTVLIDAAIFETPLLAVAFDESPKNYYRGIKRYYDYLHIKKLIDLGGINVADNKTEFITLVRKILSGGSGVPSGGEKVISSYDPFVDGKSANRLARVITQALK